MTGGGRVTLLFVVDVWAADCAAAAGGVIEARGVGCWILNRAEGGGPEKGREKKRGMSLRGQKREREEEIYSFLTAIF